MNVAGLGGDDGDGGRRSLRLSRAWRPGVRAAIAAGAVVGLAVGIVVSVTTDLPLAPEAGLLLGALLGWLSRRKGTT
jgi:hypothetical protein